ncbi:MAG: DUF1579 domain-containing protein [Acidobacteriia bacterium]|nr:DUF1579 domain-containing protein [Terriglobia bacterium]
MRFARAFLTLTLVVILAGLVFGTDQEKKPATKAAAKPAMDEKAAMAMMEKLATPSEGHKKLDLMVGTWHAKNTMWMDPSKPPVVSEGTSEHKWILGGRFLEQRFEGTFMNMPFSGIGYTGYDNYKKKYVSVWMDSAATSIMNMTGSFDASGKILTTTGKMDDFTTGKTMTVREKMTLTGKDEILFEMWGPDPTGKEYRMMEIQYTRKGQ